MKIKKHIPVIMTLCVVAAVCGGCATEETPANPAEYEELNAKLKLNYSQIVLTVTNEIDEKTVLNSEYTMKFSGGTTTITYSVEQLSELSLDSTASEKITLVGEAKVENGNVSYVSGDSANLDVLTAGAGLNFKKEYFANIDLTGVYLDADVTNPGGFMGSALDCTEMKVYATFLVAFYDIKVTYTAQNGNHVEYLYTFKQ